MKKKDKITITTDKVKNIKLESRKIPLKNEKVHNSKKDQDIITQEEIEDDISLEVTENDNT